MMAAAAGAGETPARLAFRPLGRVGLGLASARQGLPGVGPARAHPAGEIDIVARRGAVLAIVEVKARADLGTAAEALDGRQRARIGRAADAFLLTRPWLAGLEVRFDVMLVRPWRLPVHLARRLAQRSLSLTAPRQESLPRPAAGK